MELKSILPRGRSQTQNTVVELCVIPKGHRGTLWKFYDLTVVVVPFLIAHRTAKRGTFYQMRTMPPETLSIRNLTCTFYIMGSAVTFIQGRFHVCWTSSHCTEH